MICFVAFGSIEQTMQSEPSYPTQDGMYHILRYEGVNIATQVKTHCLHGVPWTMELDVSPEIVEKLKKAYPAAVNDGR